MLPFLAHSPPMKRNCPKTTCYSDQIIKKGFYFRANDSRKVQRFQCKICETKFSSSTGTLEFRQRKRRINHQLLKLFSIKVTQRDAARFLGVNKKTVARRFEYWATKAAQKNVKMREKLKKRSVTSMQFDDLITKEKTKLKPLSITVAMDANSRFILQANVSQIPAFGHLATISKKKYGYRKSLHQQALEKTFKSLEEIVHPLAQIKSDEHKSYEPFVRKYFPQANYKQYKSEKGSVIGQGELKKVQYDPLFGINHSLAMLRGGVSTLVRRTWAVTQDPKRLQGHLEIFMYYFNNYYLKGPGPAKGVG